MLRKAGLDTPCHVIPHGIDLDLFQPVPKAEARKLAGMPLDNGPHNGEPPWRMTRFTTEVADQDEHWQRAINFAFEGRVKSLSGRTRDWLGAPS